MVLFGPLLDVEIGPPRPSDAPRSILKGLIDTGASDVCLDVRVAESLGLKAVDQGVIGVVGGSIQASIYLGGLSVPALGYRSLTRLYAVRLRDPTHQVILGRSFLQHFIVTFDGPNGTFTFAEPRADYSGASFDE